MLQIGVDTHKFVHVFVAIENGGKEVGRLSLKHALSEYSKVLTWAKKIGSERQWGIENSGSYGRTLAEYLLQEGEIAFEIPPHLTARQRRLGLNKNKNDYQDALAIARNLAIEAEVLIPLTPDEARSALRCLSEERERLVGERTNNYNRLHKELLYLEPTYQSLMGDIKSVKGMAQCQKFLANYTGTWLKQLHVQSSQRIMAQIDLFNHHIEEVLDEINKQMKNLNSPLESLKGIGTIRAAQLEGEIGSIERFSSSGQLAKFSGIAPIEVASAGHRGHRVNPGGNRCLNKLFHGIALTQIRCNSEARAYYQKKIQEGKTKRMALRALKRKLVDIVFAMLKKGRAYVLPLIA